ncbi:copper chaperone PCu(A)C [Cumulibacter soli]|uniref:copper chaperone PCu(A)C n=1 Tax=Cumulibacter soli TaxID=2546344 RepID=UPI001067ED43|nr:copper chaperone PCu(A)C [Cumulibacter soli]
MKSIRIAAVASVFVLLVSGCSAGEEGDSSGSESTTAGTESVDESQAAAITATDGWVKAAAPEEMMTAAFVVLQNDSDADVHVKSASTDMSDETELHEMIEQNGEMVMQEAQGGLTIPAGGSLELEPGGFHIMIMGLSDDVVVGETYAVTLTLDDDSEVTFDVIAKDFAGANEEYDGGHDAGGDHGADHGNSNADG